MADPVTPPLHVVSSGEGDPVVLLHSGGMSSRQWRPLIRALEKTHRVIAPDFLGSGDNPPWPEDQEFGFEMDADAVARLLRDLAGPAHLVGHSYGGLVALTLARSQPRQVRSLTVYDPVAFGVLHAVGDPDGLADLARADDYPVFTDDARGGGEAWLEVFVDYWNGPGSWRALPDPTKQAFLRVGRKVYAEVRSLLRDRTGAAAYAGVTAPTLLLGGQRSPLAVRRVVELLAGSLPSATLRIVEGAGHMGPITHGDVVNRLVVEHIRQSAS